MLTRLAPRDQAVDLRLLIKGPEIEKCRRFFTVLPLDLAVAVVVLNGGNLGSEATAGHVAIARWPRRRRSW
jgi:hypothetical protein